MAAVTSTYTDPSDSFVWWVEGDKLAIATTEDDGGTTETATGKYKAAIIGSGSDYVTNGLLISYYAEPDEVTAVTGSGSTVDLDNQLQPLLIDFVKAHLLFDAAAREKDPNQSAIKMQSGQVFLNNFKEGLIRYGSKKSDKTGGTRAILPFSFK
jgi:hypothetical protein|tara:strand:- start:42 stop:503 length:462 start_codon:yes stop_codon:yes gene_type:complete